MITVLVKHKALSAFLLYALIICAIYFQVAFFGKSLLPNLYYPAGFTLLESGGREPVNTFNIDLGTPAFYEMPINYLVGDMYRKGIIPLWNLYQGGGSPLAAQYSTRAFFPYQILEDISPYWLWDYFMLARLIIAAFFTYLFLKLLGISSPCAFLGGIFYALCGSFTWFINLEQFTNVAMMAPVCLFAAERLVLLRNKRRIAEYAIVFALMLLAGQPEIAIYILLLAALYYFFRVLMQRPKFFSFLKAALKFIGAFILGLSLSSFLIFPFLEFVFRAHQCHPLGGTMGVQSPAPLAYAAGILIPSSLELPTFYHIFLQNGAWDFLGGYTGVLMFYLVLLGFFYKGKYRPFFLFFALFGFSIILKNFGFPLITWIGRLPFLDQSWSPRWAGPAWTLSLSCASAIGLEMFLESKPKNKVIPWIVSFLILGSAGLLAYKAGYLSQLAGLNSDGMKTAVSLILGGLLAALSVIIMSLYLFTHAQKTKGFVYGVAFLAILELWFYVPRGSAFPWTAFRLVPFFLGIPVIFLLLKERWRLSIAGIIFIFALYAFIDLKSPSGFPDRQNIFKEPEYVRFLKEDKGYFRILAGEGILFPNLSSSFQLFDIRYINSLSPIIYQNYVDSHLLKESHTWCWDRLWFTGLPDLYKAEPRSIYEEVRDNFLYYRYLGLKYILTSKGTSSGLPLVYDKEVKIYEIPEPFPRVYIARKLDYAFSYQEAQRLMGEKGFDMAGTVVLEENPPAWYKTAVSAPDDSYARIDEYSANQIKIYADLDADGVLVLTDIFYPGWKAYVDKKEVKVYRVNGLARGVFLEKGSRSVMFKYDPFSFKVALIILSAGLAVCLFLCKSKPLK